MPIVFTPELYELIRSRGRDREVFDGVRSAANRLAQEVMGIRWITQRAELVTLMAEWLYFMLTTGLGNQTLGEEYVGLVQVIKGTKTVPSAVRRTLVASLQVFGPYAAKRALVRLRNRVDSANRLSPQERDQLLKLIAYLQSAIEAARLVNLAIFYISGSYYQLSKRFTGIGYVTLRTQTNPDAVWWFRRLGWLMVAQLGVSGAMWLWYNFGRALSAGVDYGKDGSRPDQFSGPSGSINDDLRENEGNNPSHRQPPESVGIKCPLCLESGRWFACFPTCGHVFCWDCANDQSVSAEACPMCRQPITAGRVVPLMNF